MADKETDDQRRRRIRREGLTAQLNIIESGQRPDFILTKSEKALRGDDEDAAYLKARTRIRRSLRRIESGGPIDHEEDEA